MNVTVNCSKCKGELKIRYACITSLSNLVLEVTPCDNINCRDCSECEVVSKKKPEGGVKRKTEQRYKPKSKAHANVNVLKCPQPGGIFGRRWCAFTKCSDCIIKAECKKEYFDKYEDDDDKE